MKKIVSIIIALVSLINVNAQRVEMNYENTFEPIFEVRNISARGTANITLNYSDVIVSINCTGFTEFSNKGVVIDDDHNCLEFVGDNEEEGAATFTVSLSDNAKQANKYIKKITFITRGNSDITSVIGYNDAGSDTDVKFVGTNRIVVEDGYSAISTFEIDFTYSDYVQLKSIMVEYGYFDDELTLTDDSYDYFGDYRYAKKVTYTRPMNSEKWGSLCLPFNYVVDDSKFSVYSIKGAGLNGSNAPITLSKVANGTEVVAGTPVFVYCTEPNLVVSAENVLVTTEDFNSSGLIYECGTTEALNDGNENPISPSLNYTFYGTIKDVTVTDAIFVENDIFKYINGTDKTFKPYRAYFTLEDNNSGTGSLTFRVLNGSNLTSVAGVCGAEGHETDVKWELTDMDNNGSLETLTISGTGAMADYGNQDDQPWKDYRSLITRVVISNGVTSIGSNAFFKCNNTGFTTIAIPASVTNIGDDAFWGCTSLTDVYYYANPTPALLSNWDLDGDDFKAEKATKCHVFDIDDWDDFTNPNVTFVGDLAGKNEFSPVLWGYDNGTQTLTISGTGAMADYNSDNQPWKDFRGDITSVVIEDGVTSIGDYAFYGCTSLTSVTIYAPELTYYGSNAFSNNASGRKIYVYSDCVDTYKTGWSAYAADIIPIEGIALTANAHDGNYWTTFYCSDTNYKIDEGEDAWAYTAEYDAVNSQLTLQKLGKVIPKNTAVIIVGADASIDMTALCNAVAEYSVGNNLHGVDVRTLKSTLGTGTFYILSKQNDKFGFFQYKGDYMPARKAYLLIPGGNAAPGLTMVFDNETTEIKTTNFTDYTDKADTWYSLDGRKLDKQPTKAGVYINGSRKVVIK